MKTDTPNWVLLYIKLREAAITVTREMYDEADNNPEMEDILMQWVNELNTALELPGDLT